ncbi:OHCU decarboxylase [Acinetobacter nectaris CIP 110549]|uniref:2-oxo-4-hydroxy-4-carboxy-5-ureidoimidazoline decarboxylase n=1 Tax=Acinetobacter nectaris CIP 110549 TaxID=1392540 RepID=V2TN81_9GAMM|nr:2-oxo-4-hydroxy-4-carboxy-5-ureidoimidazoline decarboxylase [Acinetobacter nectaris]ESK38787.1 OHCU decarboxylase [Acinetobacter nectaris CIP 110549]
MQLTVFNHSSSTEIQDVLIRCVNIPSWVKAIDKMRPYKSKEALLDFAKTLAQNWTWQEILGALNEHPKIGEKPKTENSYSNKEQEKISTKSQDKIALVQANMAYENKFGFIFLIKAMGLSTSQVLTEIELRLENNLDTEKKCVHEQLMLITLLRLEQEIV